jgi:hypothetical protein
VAAPPIATTAAANRARAMKRILMVTPSCGSE